VRKWDLREAVYNIDLAARIKFTRQLPLLPGVNSGAALLSDAGLP